MRKVPKEPNKTKSLLNALQNDSILAQLSWKEPAELICEVVTAIARRTQNPVDIGDLADFLTQTRCSMSIFATESISVTTAVVEFLK